MCNANILILVMNATHTLVLFYFDVRYTADYYIRIIMVWL